MRFRLVQHFTVASLVAIVFVAVVLMYFERQQGGFFRDVQDQEALVFKQTQDDFVKRQDHAARRDLLAIHESGNVNLTRLFANALWERDFAPYVARATQVPVDHCRAMGDVKDEKSGKMIAPAEKKACFSEVGKKFREFPDFAALNAKVFDAMKKSTVFKIKVFDLRGITVYSSEPQQMGEDKLANAGWKAAAEQGKPISELTFRDKFSAFEGVVEKRDLISSYLPVLAPGSDRIVGVFEVYSDVTPFLNQIKATSAAMKKTADENQQKLAQQAQENQDQVESASFAQIAIVGALLLALYAGLLVIVRRAQRIIDQQAKDRDLAQQQLAQAEKMATLGQMVAGVAHQLNSPLAFSQNNVTMVRDAIDSLQLPVQVARKFADIMQRAEGDQVVLNIAGARQSLQKMQDSDVDLEMLKHMLGDVLDGIGQMSELVVNLRDFTRLDRAKTAAADINKALHTVVYIAKSSMANNVEVVEEFGDLPPVECNVSQLNQVFLNLINNAAQAMPDGGRIMVRSGLVDGRARIEVQDTGTGIADDVLPHVFEMYYTTKPAGEGTGLGLPIARDIVREHGGELTVTSRIGEGTTFVIDLPVKIAGNAAAAA
jgi:signal transduction histidine kinase